MHTPWRPVVALLLNALVWGCSWWPFRQLQALGVHPLWATALIYGFAMLCLLLWQLRAWRAWAPALAHTPGLWALAVAAGLTNVGFNWAVTTGDVVRVVLLFYLMPAWSILVAWWLLSEKPTLAAVLRLALALTGVVIVLKTPDTPWPVPSSLADGLALLGGLCFALTNVLLRKLEATPDTARAFAMFGGGMGMAVLVAGGSGLAVPPLSASWLPWVGLISIAFLGGNLALQFGAARLAAHSTALIMLSEVVFASASALAWGHAQLHARTLWGGGLVLLAAVLAALPQPGQPEQAHNR
jgi:drug/metabolite transporter (DMT)-like permease